MARNHAAKVRQGLNPKNGKATSSASERGAYGRTRPKADKSVRRAREVATDPRLQRARELVAESEAALRALEAEQQLAQVVDLPRPAPEPIAQVLSLPQLGSPAMTPRVRASSSTSSTSAADAVASIKPEPEAWRIALDLAGGDSRRLRVVDRTTVLVLNNPR